MDRRTYGKPTALRKNSNRGKDGANLLRIDFPGELRTALMRFRGKLSLKSLKKYELAFQYRNDEKSGETSFFYEFADRNSNPDDEQKAAGQS